MTGGEKRLTPVFFHIGVENEAYHTLGILPLRARRMFFYDSYVRMGI
jgi:hypothetical protein